LNVDENKSPDHEKAFMFDNPVLWLFFLYYFASMVNDAVTFWIGWRGILTPRQIAVFIGMVSLLFQKRLPTNMLFRNSIWCLFIFYFVCLASFVICLIFNSLSASALESILTTGGNLLWLFAVGGALSSGLTERDLRSLVWGILLLGAIPLLSGCYELIMGTNILHGVWMEDSLASFFHVRGFHADNNELWHLFCGASLFIFSFIGARRRKKIFLSSPVFGRRFTLCFSLLFDNWYFRRRGGHDGHVGFCF